MSDAYFPGVQVVEKSFQPGRDFNAMVKAFGAFIGRADQGPTIPTEVLSWSDFTRNFGTNYTDLHNALSDFFSNGGRSAYVVRIAGTGAAAASMNVYDDTITTPVPGTDVPLFTVTATNPGVWGNEIHAVTYVRDTTNKRFDVALFKVPAGTVFDATKRNSEFLLDQWLDLSLDPSDARYLYAIANVPSTTGSPHVQFSGQSYNPATPTIKPMPGGGGGFVLTGGVAGAYTSPYDPATSYAAAVAALNVIPGPAVLNLPGMSSSSIVKSAIQAAEARGDMFVVVDPPMAQSPAQIVTYSVTDLGLGTLGARVPSFAALYYPWAYLPTIGSPVNGRTTLRAPGGAVVGAMVSTDQTYGVWKAPAGTQTILAGAVKLERELTDADLTTLNNAHVNALKPVRNAGICIMGARTLKRFGLDRYVNVRRSLIDIAETLRLRTEFAIFENNNEALWERLRGVCSTYLGEFWQSGGLRGGTAEQAYYVRCDASNNTPSSTEQGTVKIEVGVALAAPAEFVVITIGQYEGQSTASLSV